jgi:hypothetical protein
MKPGTTPDPTEFADVIRLVAREAAAYLDELPDRPVRSPHHEAAAKRFVEPFPEHGHGATQTLERLVRDGFLATVRVSFTLSWAVQRRPPLAPIG